METISRVLEYFVLLEVLGPRRTKESKDSGDVRPPRELSLYPLSFQVSNCGDRDKHSFFTGELPTSSRCLHFSDG